MSCSCITPYHIWWYESARKSQLSQASCQDQESWRPYIVTTFSGKYIHMAINTQTTHTSTGSAHVISSPIKKCPGVIMQVSHPACVYWWTPIVLGMDHTLWSCMLQMSPGTSLVQSVWHDVSVKGSALWEEMTARHAILSLSPCPALGWILNRAVIHTEPVQKGISGPSYSEKSVGVARLHVIYLGTCTSARAHWELFVTVESSMEMWQMLFLGLKVVLVVGKSYCGVGN